MVRKVYLASLKLISIPETNTYTFTTVLQQITDLQRRLSVQLITIAPKRVMANNFQF